MYLLSLSLSLSLSDHEWSVLSSSIESNSSSNDNNNNTKTCGNEHYGVQKRDRKKVTPKKKNQNGTCYGFPSFHRLTLNPVTWGPTKTKPQPTDQLGGHISCRNAYCYHGRRGLVLPSAVFYSIVVQFVATFLLFSFFSSSHIVYQCQLVMLVVMVLSLDCRRIPWSEYRM